MGSSNDAILGMFSTAFIVVISLLLVIPILRRKQDLFTAWNFFLVGAVVFGGLSGYNAVNHEHYLGTYKTSDYNQYYLGVVVFYTTIVLTYHFLKWPCKMAGKNFLKWPELTPATAPLIILPLGLSVVFQLVPLGIPGVQEFMMHASLSAPVIGFACAVVLWLRSPTNVFLFSLVLLSAGMAVFAATANGTSRRYLIAALAVAPIGFYWVWLRYKSTPIILGWIGAMLACAIPLLMAFTVVRHFIKHNSETNTERFSLLVKELPEAIRSGGSVEGFMGQDSVEASLMLIHLLNDGSKALEVQPLYSPYWVLVNPIPRSMWPDKPISLGILLPHKSGISSKGLNFNIGVNVVSQCYYDGGLIVHILYAIGFGSFLRFIDELLVRQAGNPYLIGALAAMSGQIIGWPRGGIEVMSLQIMMVCFITAMISWIGSAILGGKLVYPRTDHLVDYPVLRSDKDRQRWMQSLSGVSPTYGGTRS